MKKILAILLAVMMICSLTVVASADYPDKGITAINPWGAGGGTDNCLRAFCAALEKQLGVTITVDNLTGASGVIGHEAIADADNDGYTIGMITWELASYAPQDMSDYTYENYIPLCRVNTDAAAITVNTAWAKENNVTDLESFIAYCKDHPGEVTMGGSSAGSVWHVAGGYLMNAADIEIKMITYSDGAAPAVKAAAQGEITGVTVSAAEARSFVESGDLTMLGIMDSVRNDVFPDVPTCAEQGYEIFYATQRGMAVPLGTDEAIVKVLGDACAAAIEDPDFVEAMANLGQKIDFLDGEAYGEYLAQAAVDVPAAMVTVGLIEAEEA
ncbi:MAG: tripartite tricarboxylate transporter substrate binding protein [Oscillospiraceae bacterium]|nr:tripartite tricarboxylate transporter substrate binding protein [Oscillospiraceae bacterium]